MKKIIVTISTLLLLFFSPAYADYNELKDSFNTYEPPRDFLTPESKDQVEGVPTNSPVPPAEEGNLLPLKSKHEKRLSGIGTADIDEETYQRISKIALEKEALIKRIRQKVQLEEIKAIAVLRNPAIQAARKKALAEIQSFDQVMNLDDSLRQYSTFTKAINNKVGPLKGKDSIKAAFPSPGLTALKGRIVENQVSVFTEKTAITAKQVVRDVEATFWSLVFVDKSFRITDETIAAFERLRDVATILYRSGKTSFQDIIKINIKLEELKEDLVTLASKKETVSIRLLELLNLPFTKIGKIDSSSLPARIPSVKKLYAIAREHRQELHVIRFQINKVASMVEMSESMMEARSDLGFSLFEADLINTTGTDAPKEAFSTKTMAAMKNNSPNQVWYGVNEPWLQQTRQTLESLKNTLISQENATDRMVRDAWYKADKDKREHLLYQKKILPLSKSALDVSTKEYEAGSIPFSQAIDSYTYWLKVKLTIAKKRSDFGTSFADLENITGKQLR
jgi:hypothetical protein